MKHGILTRIARIFAERVFKFRFGWHRPLACAVRRPAGRNGKRPASCVCGLACYGRQTIPVGGSPTGTGESPVPPVSVAERKRLKNYFAGSKVKTMNLLHYNVIFDVTQAGFQHWSLLVWTVAVIILTIGYCWSKLRAGWRPLGRTIPGLVFLCLFSSFFVFMSVVVLRDYFNLLSAMRHSQCQVTEGAVTQFSKPTSVSAKGGSRSGEAFFVNGKQFKYFDKSMQNGFTQRGIIREGMQVRIYYLGNGINNDIARLEIAQ
jgi:hypothetical protein